ncbi:MAG: hypothetical protein BroJett021_04410 [Chloroflexota bacterium]|nr:MAG: hypothetical protein BroJett021_04410 [Chloroflexota bacterium]
MPGRYILSIAVVTLAIALLALVFDVIGLISYGLIVAGIWIAIGVSATWFIALVLTKLEIVKKHFALRKFLKLPMLLLIAGGTGVLVANLSAPPALPPGDLSANEQIRYMYETDQRDRLALRFLQLNQRDQARAQQILELHQQKMIRTPADLYQSAMILQHGTTPDHYELAYLFAKEADEAGFEGAEGLWKAAYDRWMLSIGESQMYGTQSKATLTIFGITVEQQE